MLLGILRVKNNYRRLRFLIPPHFLLFVKYKNIIKKELKFKVFIQEIIYLK